MRNDYVDIERFDNWVSRYQEIIGQLAILEFQLSYNKPILQLFCEITMRKVLLPAAGNGDFSLFHSYLDALMNHLSRTRNNTIGRVHRNRIIKGLLCLVQVELILACQPKVGIIPAV